MTQINSKGELEREMLIAGRHVINQKWDDINLQVGRDIIQISESSLKPEVYPDIEYKILVNLTKKTFLVQDPNAEGPIPGS